MRFVGEYDVKPETVVKLTVDDSRKDGRCYLRVNGKAIMGFQDGEYCLYTDAGHDKVEGIKFDDDNFITQHDGTF